MRDPHCSTNSQDKNVDLTLFFDVRESEVAVWVIGTRGRGPQTWLWGLWSRGVLEKVWLYGPGLIIRRLVLTLV